MSGLILSCEHGGHRVPATYRSLFVGHEALLESHRGWDAGALGLARILAEALDAPLHAATVSRLVVDLNRSPHHPRVLSSIMRQLSPSRRREAIERHHRPHWLALHQAIASAIDASGSVIHVAVHSFTPVLDGQPRRTDLGLLYHPGRCRERELADRLIPALRQALGGWVVHRNQPYRGRDDGLPTALRKRFADPDYAGFELEINQSRLVERSVMPALSSALIDALSDLSSYRQ